MNRAVAGLLALVLTLLAGCGGAGSAASVPLSAENLNLIFVVNPSNANTNQTLYIVRHAEAHPDPAYHFEDGNYVGAGQCERRLRHHLDSEARRAGKRDRR